LDILTSILTHGTFNKKKVFFYKSIHYKWDLDKINLSDTTAAVHWKQGYSL